MSPIVTLIIIQLCVLIVFIIIILIKYHKDILAFFFPEKWLRVLILHSDNQFTDKLVSYPKKPFFNIKDKTYFIHDKEFKDQSVIYKKGKVSALLYNESNPFPLDYRNIQALLDPEVLRKFEELEISGLYDKQAGIFTKDLILGLAVGVVVGFVASSFLNKTDATPLLFPLMYGAKNGFKLYA